MLVIPPGIITLRELKRGRQAALTHNIRGQELSKQCFVTTPAANLKFQTAMDVIPSNGTARLWQAITVDFAFLHHALLGKAPLFTESFASRNNSQKSIAICLSTKDSFLP